MRDKSDPFSFDQSICLYILSRYFFFKKNKSDDIKYINEVSSIFKQCRLKINLEKCAFKKQKQKKKKKKKKKKKIFMLKKILKKKGHKPKNKKV